MRRRGYSKDFTPRGKGRSYLRAAIPDGFWTRVQRKARREGVSLRALILTLLTEWLEEGDQNA